MTTTVCEPVAFEADGVTLRGSWRPAGTSEPAPAVAMIHGFSATSRGMVADRYAAAFAEAGIGALIVDTRGLGTSDGEPRGRIDPWRQARDYLAAIDHLVGRSDVDSHRVAVWGDSMSGGVALVVAAVDERISAVVAQVPACGDTVRPSNGAGDRFEAIVAVVGDDDLDVRPRTVEGPKPVVSLDQLGSPSFLRPVTAYRWFLTYGAAYGTEWANSATVSRLSDGPEFDVQACIPHVTAPTLMVIAEHDEMPGADADVARVMAARAPGVIETVEVAGGHFGLLYHETPEFNHSAAAQSRFLRRVLLA